MKFIKENTVSNNLIIPAAALKLSGIPADGKIEFHALPNILMALKGRMTAMELIQTLDALTDFAAELVVQLGEVCGDCDGCDGECPFEGGEEEDIVLPDYLREEAGIPRDAKLCAFVDEDEGTVTISESGHRYDLRDVPPGVLSVLTSSGVCHGELEEHLAMEDIVYGV